jgi:ZIP family zinc transporter
MADLHVNGDFGFLLIAAAAALASPLGGWLGLRFRTGTLSLSILVGLAGGVLLGTCAFEMMPSAQSDAGTWLSTAGFLAGFLIVYGFDLYINHGFLAGEESDEWHAYSRLRRKSIMRQSDVKLLATATASEELIEGLSIGVSLAIKPSLGLMVAAAILIDNIVEGMGIAALTRAEEGHGIEQKTYRWTMMIGLALFASAAVGWIALRTIPAPLLGTLVALGAGAIFYLTITDLLPKSEKTQYLQSAAVAAASGFLLIFMLSRH